MVIQTWIDFKVEVDPALLELALPYAVRIAEEHDPINDKTWFEVEKRETWKREMFAFGNFMPFSHSKALLSP